VEVCPANGAGFDLKKDLSFGWGWFGKLRQPERKAGTFENHCAHETHWHKPNTRAILNPD
jgi:hypothetical protein